MWCWKIQARRHVTFNSGTYTFSKPLKLQNTVTEKSRGLTNNYKVSTRGISAAQGIENHKCLEAH